MILILSHHFPLSRQYASHRKTEKERYLDKGRGGGARKPEWSSTNHSILSDIPYDL
jgi:hypothetical protein